MAVSVTNDTATLKIDTGGAILNPEKSKTYIEAQGNNVKIGWDDVHYVRFPYTDFTSPSGVSARDVASQIAAFLDT